MSSKERPRWHTITHSRNMLSIYTRSKNPLGKEYWKRVIRSVFRKYSGPDAVADSLLRGLSELGIPHQLNKEARTGDTALVLSSVHALQHAINLRREGEIAYLIAGPNVVAHPDDAHKIMRDDAIDIVLVPSEWVRDFWAHEAPELKSKLHIWAAGTKVVPLSSRAGLPIIYDKLGDTSLLQEAQKNIGDHKLFTYGTFFHSEYLKALEIAPYLIYLARSESQGLALQEAWAHDVPTLVNKSTHWERNGLAWDAPQINCPYLTPHLGGIFEKASDLRIMSQQASAIHPKEYCDAHLSDRASTQALLQLI